MLIFNKKTEVFIENQINLNENKQPVSSFMERMTDVFSSPVKLYDEVTVSPVQNSSWVIPYIISLVISILFTIALFSNQSLREQILEPQLNQQHQRVERGEITQEQADSAEEFIGSSSIMLIISAIGMIAVVSISTFGVPLVIWLFSKWFFKSKASYMKHLEIYGLSSIIGILNIIVILIMMHFFNSVYATPGLSLLLMKNYNYESFLHKFIASFNFVTIWQVVVYGIGVAKASHRNLNVGILMIFGLWLLYVILSSFKGIIF